MIEIIGAFLAGGAATGLAVLPYAIRSDRAYNQALDEIEQQAHALANARAHSSDADHRLVDAAFQLSEDLKVIERLNLIVTNSEAEISSLNARLSTLSNQYHLLEGKRT